MPIIDITDELLTELGIGISAVSAPSTTPSNPRWDCTIGGLPFLFGMSREHPFKRETATFRRDRIDTERNPGEQSLDSGYWLRSQASWHYGSGIASAEPLEISDTEAQFRYKRGGGVDPWTPGQMTLLHDVTEHTAFTATGVQLLGVDTGVLYSNGTGLSYATSAPSTAAVTWGGAGTIKSLTTDGGNYYAADTTGIYKGALPSAAGALVWNTGATPVVRWVKSRLMAAVGASLYELTGAGPALPTALYTHPTAGWVWTDLAEGPSAIYAAGYVGDISMIYRITVTVSGATVTLGAPTVVAEMPRGEQVKSTYSYVGTYLVVGTSKGCRIALINTDGSLSLGPLVVRSDDGCVDAVASGSFVYVTVGTKGDAGDRVNRAGLYRIDLSTNLNGNPLDFAASADIVVPTGTAGTASSGKVTVASNVIWFATNSGGGIYRQNDNYVSEGWVETGRIRMGTVESKAWRSIRIINDSAAEGATTAYASSSDSLAPSTWSPVVSNTQTDPDQTGSLNAAAPVPLSSIYVAFKFTRGATATVTPIFQGYQIKSVPAPRRAELVQVPVMCFDREQDRQGVPFGRDGGAWMRFGVLKQLEATSATVQWVDYTTGEAAEAYIEQVSWDRVTPPTRNSRNAGGIVTVLLRLV